MKNLQLKNNVINSLSDKFYIYPDSFRFPGEIIFFILKRSKEKYLGAMAPVQSFDNMELTGQIDRDIHIHEDPSMVIRIFQRNSINLNTITKHIPGLLPSPLGNNTTFGFGDRLGIANAAHIRTIKKQKGILPVLAQQSVRELIKTSRDFKKVVESSLWNVLQEGYEGKWGADADHIKDKENFIKALEADMTMYTLDTADHLDEKVIKMNDLQIRDEYDLDSDYINLVKSIYLDKKLTINNIEMIMDEDTLIRLALIYGKAIDFARDIFEFLKGRLQLFDYEISFDETNTVTTLEAHFFIVSELRRLGIEFSSIALRFPGTFEKGIDYIGKISEFENSIKVHSLLCEYFGGYKLSLHSGSDKLSIYPAFNKSTKGNFHIKTSGTSWLDAVRAVSLIDPKFFREIYVIASNTFDENKKAYHVSFDRSDFQESLDSFGDKDLPEVLNNDILRQVFHIAYGAILDREKDRFMDIIISNEETYYQCLEENFNKHFNALKAV